MANREDQREMAVYVKIISLDEHEINDLLALSFAVVEQTPFGYAHFCQTAQVLNYSIAYVAVGAISFRKNLVPLKPIDFNNLSQKIVRDYYKRPSDDEHMRLKGFKLRSRIQSAHSTFATYFGNI